MTTSPIDDGGPAFPSQITAEDRNGTPIVTVFKGMTLRDYFAIGALTGLLADSENPPCQAKDEAGIEAERQKYAKDLAAGAYMYADAMLAARKGAK